MTSALQNQIVETPAVQIDLAIVKRNIDRVQKIFDELGVAFRPHIKTHKIPEFAKMQIAAGACGITCQKISEAEVMADSGISDIMITYNILGREKLERLLALSRRCRLSVTADNEETVEGLSATFSLGGHKLEVLVECDTGMGRCGVQNPAEAMELARKIDRSPALRFGGLMTYPPMADMKKVDNWLSSAKALIEAEGLECERVSNGGTPNLKRVGEVKAATEHRAGTYIYNDRSLISSGACEPADCALRVIATVVSRPTENRAIIDAGSKALTSDLIGLTDYGLIVEAPGARIFALSEEHGHIDLTSTDWRPAVGDRVAIIPNHACVVSNLVDRINVLNPDGSTEKVRVAARGCSY